MDVYIDTDEEFCNGRVTIFNGSGPPYFHSYLYMKGKWILPKPWMDGIQETCFPLLFVQNHHLYLLLVLSLVSFFSFFYLKQQIKR